MRGRSATTVTHTCAACGIPFTARSYERRRFCSRACSDARRYGSPEERFLKRTKAGANGCILWTGKPDGDGYGKLQVAGKSVKAHQFAWRLANGPIPGGLCVLHRCDNPPCVNVEHLFLGTNADNMADRDAKARQARGPRNGGGNKLSEAQVLAIRRRYAGGDVSQQQLADEHGVNQTLISVIVRRRRWKHLP